MKARVYAVYAVIGGVSQGVNVFATAESARAAFYEMASFWADSGTITNALGQPTTAKKAAAAGYFGTGGGDNDYYLECCTVTP